ncbi:nitric oxide reductase F protein [Sulfitobacter sp. F26169L]|uniref:nitric oxide reductase F protein n=1 Tax=Sulfitobacter sp. F26169L TaxID=2996015 RepID=UPI0022608BA7|nr:nitric oxide reductase F protein [Sulfitobacter sp. F26169L]
MTQRSLYIAWAVLVALSIGSTILSVSGIWTRWPIVAGMAVLVLAWQKARIILLQYLGLAEAPSWRWGIEFALALLCLLLLGLYLLPLIL